MKAVWAALFLVMLTNCTYLKHTAIQKRYKTLQETDPTMLNLKHMLEEETYIVHGKLKLPRGMGVRGSIAVAAFSNRFRENELVDIFHQVGSSGIFGLNLPQGDYRLYVLHDRNRDGFYGSDEAIGHAPLKGERFPREIKVMAFRDFAYTPSIPFSVDAPIEVRRSRIRDSVFYPAGSIRELDDPVFDDEMVTLGQYDPASFLEAAPQLFYALEKDIAYKIPVVFVHGIGGSPRNFDALLAKLDRRFFKPFYFYYPSGGDLSQMADFFYDIFLSTRYLGDNDRIPTVIVAHSMGGLVVREALNKLEEKPGRNAPFHFISMASPFGGHPAAAMGEKHGMIVLPSWRDLNPHSDFVAHLFRHRPTRFEHVLIHAFANDRSLKWGENSDGVVPLSSQLRTEAQNQSTQLRGFAATHRGVLDQAEVVDYVLAYVHALSIDYPQDHIASLLKGGFEVRGTNYSARQKHLIETVGHYFLDLTEGRLEPVNADQAHFVRASRGEVKPKSHTERGWIKYLRERDRP
ncbi:DUF413 domain-containing protein [Sulfidibacter corallicola]|uniref:Macrodomain Ori protein n=1 Tax=Sulfidibacter corallicola TaxID=2818388 RepID=A0A8A4TPE6_SULCO|nr:DUF413 domain-containing protein [Sulfidibacter corallicola]QTD48455.1 DUF413 domain-containing protein [Sulfidibacter corallicola]